MFNIMHMHVMFKLAGGMHPPHPPKSATDPYPNPEPQQRKNAILPAEASVFISKRVQYKSCSIQWISNTI